MSTISTLKATARGFANILIVAGYVLVGFFSSAVSAVLFTLFSTSSGAASDFSATHVFYLVPVGVLLGLVFGIRRAASTCS